MINLALHITKNTTAKIDGTYANCWVDIVDPDLNTSDVALFMPFGVPVEKAQAIADAINDALDTVRTRNAARETV